MSQPLGMRERILAAAVEVMADRGVTGATTKAIARLAGVSEGSIYNHFENKSALFAAAFGTVGGTMREAAERAFEQVGRGSLEDNLAQWALTATRFYARLLPMTGPVLSDRGLRSWLHSPEGPARRGGPVQGHEALARYLSAEQQAGRLLPEADPALIAGVLLGACQQHAFVTIVGGPEAISRAGLPDDEEEFARGVVRTVLHAHV